MKEDELVKKLNNILEELRKATTDKDNEKIANNVEQLNKLWKEASTTMLKMPLMTVISLKFNNNIFVNTL